MKTDWPKLHSKRKELITAMQQSGARKGDPAKTLKTATLAVGDVLDLVSGSLEESKAEDITTIDIKGKSALGDYMVVASGRSQRHVAAIADHLLRELKSGGVKSPRVEGLQHGDWVLIDIGDIIIHLFRPEVREFYGLEKMWLVSTAADQ